MTVLVDVTSPVRCDGVVKRKERRKEKQYGVVFGGEIWVSPRR